MNDKKLNELRDKLAKRKSYGYKEPRTDNNFKAGFDAAIQALKDNYVEKSKANKLIEALKFECGNRCAEENPCNAKEAIRDYEAKVGI